MAKLQLQKKEYHKINNNIRAQEVRIVGDFENSGEIVSLREALDIADEMDADLVEINGDVNPPICKVIDYNKYLYELKKKKKDQEKKQKENIQEVKELRFGPNTDDHDFDFKLKHAEEFLKRGDMVKAYVFFKGREICYKEKGEKLLLRLIEGVSELGTPDNYKPVLEGKKMIIFIRPTKKKAK